MPAANARAAEAEAARRSMRGGVNISLIFPVSRSIIPIASLVCIGSSGSMDLEVMEYAAGTVRFST